jgi:hypothetical protein
MKAALTFPKTYCLTGARRELVLRVNPNCHTPTIFDRFRRCASAWPSESESWDNALQAFAAFEIAPRARGRIGRPPKTVGAARR